MEDRIHISLDGEDRELFMSRGLLLRLAALVGETTDLMQIYMDPTLNEMILTEVLKRRRPTGEQAAEFSLDDVEISNGDCDKIVEWVGDHVTDFFIGRVQMANRALPQYKKFAEAMVEVSNSTHTSTGSEE